ncbi:hypothetical protein P280DRAFT_466508 [Massarina eburnea CBS 473.64]|uniref:MARVEL domain-containing protein n=1 Tax=Massarina eburnea CBS 473.64 TaxID=1395130 RepID=A0A6A6SBI4_9PLEO|nr:hypothetical protein P280DRAFT_466508 [Massarina eburnea CBS 473.64]
MSHPSPQVSPIVTPAQPVGPSHTTPTDTHGTHTASTPAAAPANATVGHASTASTLAPTPAPPTFFEKLDAGDAKWTWKIGMRIVLIIIGLIGLGCAAWTVASFSSANMYYGYEYDMEDGWSVPWTLITFTLSIIWSAVCILVFCLRTSHGPVHPGAQVGVDLVLWLGYIVTGLFAVVAVISVKDFGSDGIIGRYSSDGPWTYAQGNNTWVYDSGYSSSYTSSSRTRSCDSSSQYSTSQYSSCADLDNYINHLWATKSARFNAELCATVCQFIALLLHLVLFIWACVDTNRRNSTKVTKDAEKLAAEIIQNMIKNGAVIPPPGQAHMQPMIPQPMPPHIYAQYQQQYQQYQQYPQQHQQMGPQMPQRAQQTQHFSRPLSSPQAPQEPIAGDQPAVPSSSNEKSQHTRFA